VRVNRPDHPVRSRQRCPAGDESLKTKAERRLSPTNAAQRFRRFRSAMRNAHRRTVQPAMEALWEAVRSTAAQRAVLRSHPRPHRCLPSPSSCAGLPSGGPTSWLQRCNSAAQEPNVKSKLNLISLGVLGLWAFSGAARADAVTDWNANAGAAAVAACISPNDNPLHESRLYAMVHLAVHDALNAIQRRSQPYAFDGWAPPGTSAEAAVATAARDVLVSQIALIGAPFPAKCISDGIARAESDYARSLAAIPAGAAKTQGIALGRAAAAAIIARRANDGSTAPLVDPNFPQGSLPGQWRFTPGSPPIAFAPDWGKVTPFVLRDAMQFNPSPPLAVSCEGKHAKGSHGCRGYAEDLEEVRRLGSDGVSAPSERTAEQTQIALFWVESSPLAWNRIARTVTAARKLDLWENARLFGLLNVALADAYVASWATKYHYRYWRPITAIREAAHDGNPGTTADPGWMSLLPTPPIPDYESAHAVEGGAAAQVMKHVFGRGHIPFTACSLTLPAGSGCNDGNPVTRRFRSFDHAAQENADSRVYVGFHFPDAVEKGLKRGKQIGEWTVDHALELVRRR
jgi:hypothetical protein